MAGIMIALASVVAIVIWDLVMIWSTYLFWMIFFAHYYEQPVMCWK
jgi:hypothetical protein